MMGFPVFWQINVCLQPKNQFRYLKGTYTDLHVLIVLRGLFLNLWNALMCKNNTLHSTSIPLMVHHRENRQRWHDYNTEPKHGLCCKIPIPKIPLCSDWQYVSISISIILKLCNFDNPEQKPHAKLHYWKFGENNKKHHLCRGNRVCLWDPPVIMDVEGN